ncbi:MAG: RNA polymerase factor sigma-54 [Candidatus Aminicenantes bacterium]|nr:RNA polymerase factor sigma-54 [Candidatus Aminicenantes bacterium]
MVLKQRLDQRQVQKLILAPALQQAIKLLPLTNLELIEVIDTELSQNPMLEIEEESLKQEEQSPQEDKDDRERDIEKKPESLEGEKKEESELPEDDIDFAAFFQDYIDNGFRMQFSESNELPSFENIVSRSLSLWDHLNWQANLTFFSQEEKEIAQNIIGNINEDGYLTSTVDEIADSMGCPAEKVEEIRSVIKEFDPVSIGSRDLQEALLTQMDYFGIEDSITRVIIENHLHLLEKSDYSQLAKLLDISLSDVKNHIEVIKRLNPAPGRKYSEERSFYIVPDIIVKKEDNELKIILNNESLPRLKINAYYKKLLSGSLKDNPEAQRFLKDKMKKAFWFLRSLDQRNQTIYKVAKFIVDKQKDFFDQGIDYIKPLTLVELAQEIGVHESTVGRVVANKYILTPRGTYSLKYFFHKSITGDYGEEISSLRIKERIRKMIASEDKKNPLSDIEIGEILVKENLGIARRTVAKYRKQLKIPPSYIRKRKFRMEEA